MCFSRGFREECTPCLLQLLEAPCIPWLRAPSLYSKPTAHHLSDHSCVVTCLQLQPGEIAHFVRGSRAPAAQDL